MSQIVPDAHACLAALPDWLLASLQGDGAAHVYVVGGFVRDLLLGRPGHDVDLAVDGDPLRLARALAGRANGAVVPLDPLRGTYRVVLRDPDGPVRVVDLTRLRALSLDGDLRGRDFTMNAIALDPVRGEPRFIDPTGGIDDLQRRRVRVAGPAAFSDDPARLLRAVRFTVQLGFDLDEETAQLARTAAPLLRRTAPERQRDEFAHILDCDDAATGVRRLDQLGLLTILLPDLELARGIEQPKEHYYDVLEHSLHTLAMLDLLLRRSPPLQQADALLWRSVWDRLGNVSGFSGFTERLEQGLAEGRSRRVTLKLAGLLHDVGKPETKSIDPRSGRTHFYGHAEQGAARADRLARALRFSGREAQYLSLLIGEHLRPGMLAAPGELPTRRALFRFFRDLGDACGDLLLLSLADHAAARGPRLTLEEWVDHVDYAGWVLRMLYEDDQVARPPRLITGNDLMRELSLQPGPLVGTLLEAIREAQAAGDVNDAESALTLARKTLAQTPTPQGLGG